MDSKEILWDLNYLITVGKVIATLKYKFYPQRGICNQNQILEEKNSRKTNNKN